MPRYVSAILGLLLASFASAACTLSLFRLPVTSPAPTTSSTAAAPSASPAPAFPAATASSSVTETPRPTAEQEATSTTPFCTDQQPRALITQFQSAIVNRDGSKLAGLVSQVDGMDVRLFRDGRVVNYDRTHAAALFESSYAVNWGLAPGSGLPAVGSFQDLIVPDLLDVLTKPYTQTCNQVVVGGVTYSATWPYPGMDFYSLYRAGSEAFGGMDWHTWLVGMAYVDGRPYLAAIMQFKWEP